ncbi:MAG: hypothetical protein JSW20_11485 [Nitrospiraceae bacterium]|nr:MAG: hypothetical protein JSW20_11485 [Nitrospiraceae bacterium]
MSKLQYLFDASHRIKKPLLFITIFIVLSGCSKGLNYHALESHMVNYDCVAATEYIENNKKDYGSNRELLFLLDAGMINMLCGNYEKSNAYFHRAEIFAEELWTKSITRESASFLLNDYTIPYSGEDFERALINLFSSINYLQLGQLDESLVEVRRLDAVLNMINDKYSKKNVYSEDAFGRYLSGLIYEADNNLNDAYIDYYKALHIFETYEEHYGTPVPSILIEDLVRAAQSTGRTDEIQSYFDEDISASRSNGNTAPDHGKIVLIHFNSIAPVKQSAEIFIPTQEGPVALAFPSYHVVEPYCRNSRMIAASASQQIVSDTEIVEDINRIAVKNLEDRRGRITLKMIARVAAKQIAIHKVKDKTARQLLNIANLFVEQADTRSWRTLPGEIYLGRLIVPAGKYDVNISLCGEGEQFVETVYINPGETRFVLYESMF